jgi:hypothetical protein
MARESLMENTTNTVASQTEVEHLHWQQVN